MHVYTVLITHFTQALLEHCKTLILSSVKASCFALKDMVNVGKVHCKTISKFRYISFYVVDA